MNLLKAGITTTEFLTSRSSSRWGAIAMILGLAVSGGSAMGPIVGGEASVMGIVAGALVSLAGVVQKLLTDLGYIKSRTRAKEAIEKRLTEEARNKNN